MEADTVTIIAIVSVIIAGLASLLGINIPTSGCESQKNPGLIGPLEDTK